MNTVQKYLFSALGLYFTARSSLAAIDPGLDKVDTNIQGVGEGNNPIETIQTFIAGLLGLLALVMVAMALYGGWKIMTSGAEDAGQEAGKKIIINAIIGIVVIFFAWTITSLVFGILQGDVINNN